MLGGPVTMAVFFLLISVISVGGLLDLLSGKSGGLAPQHILWTLAPACASVGINLWLWRRWPELRWYLLATLGEFAFALAMCLNVLLA